jgi:hypothetical protein
VQSQNAIPIAPMLDLYLAPPFNNREQPERSWFVPYMPRHRLLTVVRHLLILFSKSMSSPLYELELSISIEIDNEKGPGEVENWDYTVHQPHTFHSSPFY